MIEIERRFLARLGPGAQLGRGSRLRQGYLSAEDPTVRIRERDGAWVLAIKSGRGVVRREIEIPVQPEAGAALLELAGDQVLAKTRYDLGRWEIDVFEGPLAGLVVAEIELERADEPLPPAPEKVELVREVTHELTSGFLASLDEQEARRFVRGL